MAKQTTETSIVNVRKNQVIHYHGRRLLVVKIETECNHPDPTVIQLETSDLGDVNPRYPSTIPAHWREDYVIQGNPLRMLTVEC